MRQTMMSEDPTLRQIAVLKQAAAVIPEDKTFEQICAYMGLADGYWICGEVAESLNYFQLADQCADRLKPEQIKIDSYFQSLLNSIINYGINIYSLNDSYMNDAINIYRFVQKLLAVCPSVLFYQVGAGAYQLGVVYVEHGQYQLAYQQFNDAAEAFAKTDELPGFISKTHFQTFKYYNYYNLAHCCEKLLDFEAAERYYILAIKTQEALENRDDVDFIRTNLRLAEMYLCLRQLGRVTPLLNYVRVLLDNLEEFCMDIFYQYCVCVSDSLMQKGQYQQVLKVVHICYHYGETWPIPPKFHYQLLYIELLTLLDLEQPEKCFDILDQITALISAHPDERITNKASLYKMHAEIWDEQGNPEKALAYFVLAEQAYEEEAKEDIFFRISLLTNWGLACIHAYHYGKAKRLSKRCIELINQFKVDQQYNFSYIPVFINLGLIYMRLMELDQAGNFLFMALNLCKKLQLENNCLRDEGLILINLAWLYLSMQQNERAQYYAQAAADLISADTQNSYFRQKREVDQILVTALARQGKLIESLQRIDAVIQNDMERDINFCRNLCLKGIILLQTDRKKAWEAFGESLALIHELKLEKTELYPKLLLNRLNCLQDHYEEDVQELEDIINADDFLDSYFKLNAYRNIVRYNITLKRHSAVFIYAAKAIMLYEKLVRDAIEYENPGNLLNSKQDMQFIYEIIFHFLLEGGEEEINKPQLVPLIDLLTHYKIGDYYLLRQISSSGEDQSERMKIELQLHSLHELSGYLQSYARLETEHDLLIKRSNQLFKSFVVHSKQTERAVTIPEEYMGFWCIDYFFPEFVTITAAPCCFAVVWQIGISEKKQLVKLCDAEVVKTAIQAFHTAVQQDHSTLEEEKTLYYLLLQPLYERLPELRLGQKLMICPDGLIATIPFEVLLDRNCRILYLPFLDLILTEKTVVTPYAALGGNPVLTADNPFGASDLQNAGDECSSVAQYLQAAGFEVQRFDRRGEEGGIPFSKSRLLADLEENHYSLIHLSTHGFYAAKDSSEMLQQEDYEQPYRNCGLLLNDCFNDGHYDLAQSVLWAEDILRIDLKQTKLVVLSSCVSGLGDVVSGNWLSGLQRACLIAGVENLVVSLWNVDEQSTGILMKYFYKNIIDGMEVDLALHNAKEQLKRYEDGIYSTPYFWAGFIYVGRLCSFF